MYSFKFLQQFKVCDGKQELQKTCRFIAKQITLIFNFRMVNQTPNTLDDLNFDQFIKTANYEETVRQLDIYYGTGMHLLSLYKPYPQPLYL